MPEHIRALIVILSISLLVFAFARHLTSTIIDRSDFDRRRNLWLVITILSFLAGNFWVYILIAGTLLIFVRAHEPNPLALFVLLLFAAPVVGAEIPGMGLINYLFSISHQRLLALVILGPAFLIIISKNETLPFGRTLPDKLLAAYLVLIISLYLRETTIADTLRQGFHRFIDTFLPYYVFSRLLKDTRGFREVMLCFVIAAMILALIGSFEVYKHWHLYHSLKEVLGIPEKFSGYGSRAGLLRAAATVGQIPLGYVIAVSLAFYLSLQYSIRSNIVRRSGIILLATGLLAPMSRGPWAGAVFLYLVFIVTGSKPIQSLLKIGIVGLVALPLIIVIPGTEKIIDLIPFIGTESEQTNITYRERLLKNSLILINRHPFLGSIEYRFAPEFEAMRQGQGIVDVVNTYLRVALETGYIGLSLFVGFFISVCWGIYKSLRRQPDKLNEECLLGRSLIAALAGILLTIFTVSSVSIIPIVYWSVAGMGTAYINMMNRSRTQQITSHQHPS